jgi:alkanesulfonate monooxygenase
VKENDMSKIELGWFLPTSGDTTAYGDPKASVPSSARSFDRITQAAENAGFEYLLIPVNITCWEAWIAGAMMAARSKTIKPLIAARPGYINPVLLAKMISTFDQLSGGRICINLIAGLSDEQSAGDGLRFSKEDRYLLMEEEVSILKALWTANGPIDFDGKFYQLKGASVTPPIYQKPYPKFYLGGGSREAWEVSAKHSDVHLFWGDHPDRIAASMAEIRKLAGTYGRDQQIGFGMRLQIICREQEADAWEAARKLISSASDELLSRTATQYGTSAANRRMQELARKENDLIIPHLWTGITKVRAGAGVAIVGNPQQCADTLQKFIDIGCHSFCLSGYLHDEEAERFGRLVLPLLQARNRERMAA